MTALARMRYRRSSGIAATVPAIVLRRLAPIAYPIAMRKRTERPAIMRLWHLGRSLVGRIGQAETNAYAAALTYNLLFALFPLALALAALVPALHLRGAQNALLSALQLVIPPEVVQLVTGARTAAVPRPAIALGGIGGYLLGMSAAFRRLFEAFRRTWGGAATKRPLWWSVLISVLLAVAWGVGLLVAMALLTFERQVLSDVLPGMPATAAVLGALRWILLLALAVLMVAVLYWVGSGARRPFRLVTPGVAVAITVWLAISFGFSLYLSRFNSYNILYGGVGAMILLLLYLNFLSYALLLGAEIDAMIATKNL